MEVTVSLSAFSSESSAGSDKAQKMGLISAGFGRYRTKQDGPITHKIIKGKLVKSAPALNVAQKLFIVEELDFAASKDLSDAVKYIKSFGLKAVDGVDVGINGNPTASVVGTKPQLVKFLKEYLDGDADDSEIAHMVKKPYNPKKSKLKSQSASTSQKLYVADDCDFAGSDNLAEVKKWCSQFGVKVVNGVEDGPQGMPNADIVGTLAQLRKFLVAYMGLDLDDVKAEQVLKPYNPKKSKLKSQSAGTKSASMCAEVDFGTAVSKQEIPELIADLNTAASTNVKVGSVSRSPQGSYSAVVTGSKSDLRKFLAEFYDGSDITSAEIVDMIEPYSK